MNHTIMFMVWSVIVWEFEGVCAGVDEGIENIVLLFVVKGGDSLLGGNPVKLVCSYSLAYKSDNFSIVKEIMCSSLEFNSTQGYVFLF